VQVKLIYNKFVSALSFEATVMEVYDADALKESPNFAAYEIEDDSLLKDLSSFALANGIYSALVEGHAAEVRSGAQLSEDSRSFLIDPSTTIGFFPS
jgi:F-type H+-transporting ATPase subunit gamma